MNKRKELGEYTYRGKYARHKADGTKENWDEAVDRVMMMHFNHLEPMASDKSELANLIIQVTEAYKQKTVLGAQRALQFGGPRMEAHPLKLFNCSASYVDRPEFFSELMYIALNGCGVGLSVQRKHIDKLPKVVAPEGRVDFVVPDSIEGWADAVKSLTNAYFYGKALPIFDYSLIRDEGTLIAGEFIAPGYKPLKKALNMLDTILKSAVSRKLRSFEACRMACIIADCVISGSVRRAALLTLFSIEDEEMLTCKTGAWWELYPELARSNNTAVILPETDKETYLTLFESAKNQGEPGLAFLKNPDFAYNPCFEVSMFCYNNQGISGFGFCNLTEINGSVCYTAEDFYKACENAAILGTFQASYTKDKYLPQATIDILERDALIGVGITGMCSNPKVLFDPEIQRKGARIVKETNKRVAKLIGINEAARTTVVKPEIKESFPDVFELIKSSQDLINCLNKLNFYYYFHKLKYSLNNFCNIFNLKISKSTAKAAIRTVMSPKEFSFKREELRPLQILLDRFTQDNWFNDDYCRWYVKKLLKTRLIVNYGSYNTKTNARYVVALKPHARASKANQVKAHILIWELYYRKCLPKNFVVVPLNGNFLDLNINNLKAIPRQERLSELCVGENNYFYVNGITLTEKFKSKKKFWSYKSKQFKKDKVCKICASNKNLVVHHLVNYRLFKDPNKAHEDWNLVVVCSSCHSKIHWGDKDLTGLIEETQLCKSIELLETLEKEGKDISLIENSFKTISSEALKKFKERSTTSREAYTVSV